VKTAGLKLIAMKRTFIRNRFKPWIDARQRFHLAHAQVQMAFELGLNPKKIWQGCESPGRDVETAAAGFYRQAV
jgi:hypothetical protein